MGLVLTSLRLEEPSRVGCFRGLGEGCVRAGEEQRCPSPRGRLPRPRKALCPVSSGQPSRKRHILKRTLSLNMISYKGGSFYLHKPEPASCRAGLPTSKTTPLCLYKKEGEVSTQPIESLSITFPTSSCP